jgi:hypothetical protein
MTHCQRIFEATMRVKGHTDFQMIRGKYVVGGLQTRWIYFRMGWELREVTA